MFWLALTGESMLTSECARVSWMLINLSKGEWHQSGVLARSSVLAGVGLRNINEEIVLAELHWHWVFGGVRGTLRDAA